MPNTHPANNWIASLWMGKVVKQNTSCDGSAAEEIGRISRVVATHFDEKGALHCQTEDGNWCPASRLQIIENSLGEGISKLNSDDPQIVAAFCAGAAWASQAFVEKSKSFVEECLNVVRAITTK